MGHDVVTVISTRGINNNRTELTHLITELWVDMNIICYTSAMPMNYAYFILIRAVFFSNLRFT
jgi:hypothetical protein